MNVNAPDCDPLLPNRRTRTLLLIGVCKPGLVVLTIGHLLLLAAAVADILHPESIASKVLAFVGALLIAGFFTYKSYKVMIVPKMKAPAQKEKSSQTRSKEKPQNGLLKLKSIKQKKTRPHAAPTEEPNDR